MIDVPQAGASATQRTAAALVSRAFAYEADVLPISYDGTVLTVGVSADSGELLERLRQQTRKEMRTLVLPVREIREALQRLYPPAAARETDSQAAHVLDQIFAAAIASYACDVHLEPTDERAGRVRLDVDGVLQHDRSLEAGLYERVVSLLKVRSNMNTGESRLPQDGRLTVTYDGRGFEVRASTIPDPAAARERTPPPLSSGRPGRRPRKNRAPLSSAFRSRPGFGAAGHEQRDLSSPSAGAQASRRILRHRRADRFRQIDNLIRVASNARSRPRQRLQRRGSDRMQDAEHFADRGQRTCRGHVPRQGRFT